MPKLFVITDQVDATALSHAVIGSRVGEAKREQAIAALRRANPGLDLDRLRPGMVIVVPELPDVVDRTVDPVDASLDDLLDRSREQVMALLAGADEAEVRRRAEADAARELLGSAEVRRLSGRLPELKENAAAAAARLEQEDRDAGEDAAAIREAVERWLPELEKLRALRKQR
jgi:hypothetical protein